MYLQEDGLELWQVLLRRSTALSSEMLAILPLLISLLAHGTDILPRCLAIFESYLLLDTPSVVSVGHRVMCCMLGSAHRQALSQACAVQLFASIHDLLGGLKLEAVKVVLHALNTVFQTSPPSTWAAALDASGCFAVYLETIANPVSAEQALSLLPQAHGRTFRRVFRP